MKISEFVKHISSGWDKNNGVEVAQDRSYLARSVRQKNFDHGWRNSSPPTGEGTEDEKCEDSLDFLDVGNG